MSKTTGQLLIDNAGFVPDLTDGILVWDSSASSTKAATLADTLSLSNNLFKILSSNATGTDVATAQPWFPTAGGVALTSSTTYLFQGILRTSRSAGTTSHTTSLLFGGTATLTSILYRAIVNTGDVVTNIAANTTAIEVATATVVKAASTSATEQIGIYIKGVVRVNAGGTFIPQFQYSAAPGGAPSILTNSYFYLSPIGTSSVTSSGTWS